MPPEAEQGRASRVQRGLSEGQLMDAVLAPFASHRVAARRQPLAALWALLIALLIASPVSAAGPAAPDRARPSGTVISSVYMPLVSIQSIPLGGGISPQWLCISNCAYVKNVKYW